MKAVVFEQFGQDADLREVPDPVPSEHGVVVRVEATGLCRSDWHGWMGHDPDITLPHVPGHELAGVVETVGRGVANWRPGERVTVPFVCACGRCAACAAGDQQGDLVGMVVSTLYDNAGQPLNMAHAVPSRTLAGFLCTNTQCSTQWRAIAAGSARCPS